MDSEEMVRTNKNNDHINHEYTHTDSVEPQHVIAVSHTGYDLVVDTE